jgi:hypothetical protein
VNISACSLFAMAGSIIDNRLILARPARIRRGSAALCKYNTARVWWVSMYNVCMYVCMYITQKRNRPEKRICRLISIGFFAFSIMYSWLDRFSIK